MLSKVLCSSIPKVNIRNTPGGRWKANIGECFGVSSPDTRFLFYFGRLLSRNKKTGGTNWDKTMLSWWNIY